MSVINKPDISKTLLGFYVATIALLAALGMLVTYLYVQTPHIVAVVGLVVIIGVEIVMISLLISFCRTKYIVTGRELVIKASVLVGGDKRISLETVVSVERTLIPFGFRLFGASFYGGYYYFLSIGRAFMVMTNFKDGVLIKTKQGNYVITPKNPDNFKQTIERKVQATR